MSAGSSRGIVLQVNVLIGEALALPQHVPLRAEKLRDVRDHGGLLIRVDVLDPEIRCQAPEVEGVGFVLAIVDRGDDALGAHGGKRLLDEDQAQDDMRLKPAEAHAGLEADHGTGPSPARRSACRCANQNATTGPAMPMKVSPLIRPRKKPAMIAAANISVTMGRVI